MLEAKKLCKRYDQTLAVKDLSFSVAPVQEKQLRLIFF